MNTMEITKFVGAICGSLLIFLLIQTAAQRIFNTHSDVVGLRIEAAEDRRAAARRPPRTSTSRRWSPPPTSAKGETIFKKCAACHKLDGVQRRRPAPQRRRRPPGRLGRRLQLLRPHAGPRRRLDARRALRLPRQPQEGRARHQDVLRRPGRSPRTAPTSSPTSSSTAADPSRRSRSGQSVKRRDRALPPAALRVECAASYAARPDASMTPSAAARALAAGPPPGLARGLARGRPRCSSSPRSCSPPAPRPRTRPPTREDRHQPRPLDLRRPEVPGRLRALRLRQPRRAEGRHLSAPGRSAATTRSPPTPRRATPPTAPGTSSTA